MATWRDLVNDHGFPAQYASVRRFVVTLRGARTPEAHPVIVTAPGEEAQVDYGDGRHGVASQDCARSTSAKADASTAKATAPATGAAEAALR